MDEPTANADDVFKGDVPVPWDTPAHASPLADLLALTEELRQLEAVRPAEPGKP